jgi:hypothetical protein
MYYIERPVALEPDENPKTSERVESEFQVAVWRTCIPR